MKKEMIDFHRRWSERFQEGNIPDDLPFDLPSIYEVFRNDLRRRFRLLSYQAALLAGTAPHSISDLITEIEMPVNAEIDAHISCSEDSTTYAIRINLGLLRFMHLASMVAVARVGLRSHTGTTVEPSYTWSEAKKAFKDLRSAFYDGNLLQSKPIDIDRLHNDQVILAGHLRGYMLDFVLAHEIGHFLLKESEFGHDILKKCHPCVEQLLLYPENCHLSPSEKLKIESHWTAELGADRIAAMLLLACHGMKYTPLAYAAAELVFLFNYFLAGSDRDWTTHPKVSTRVYAFRQCAQVVFPDSTVLQELVSLAHSSITDILEEPC